MCGACSGAPSDWAVPLVAGPRRRDHVARFFNAVTRGLRVRPGPRGWQVARPTGGTTMTSTLDDLIDATATQTIVTTWRAMEACVRRIEDGLRRPADECDDYVPSPAPEGEPGCAHGTGHGAVQVVMTSPSGAPVHVRLAAFCLGVRTFDDAHVAMDVTGRPTPFRLLAAHGRIVGAEPLARRHHRSKG
jgi:hypothetical protein